MSATVLIAVLLSAMTIFYLLFWSRKKNGPPGPRGVPLLGYLPFVGKNPAETYMKLSKEYGPILSISLGLQPVLVLNDYNTIVQALVKMPDIFSGRPSNKIIELLSNGYGISLRDYDHGYKEQRKFCLATLRGFGFGRKTMEHKIWEEIEHLLVKIESHGNESFNCHKAISVSVAFVICKVVLGRRCYDEEYKILVGKISKGFSNKFEAFCINIMMVAPALRFLPPFSMVMKTLKQNMIDFTNVVGSILEQHKKSLDPSNPRDFVDEYLVEMEKRQMTGLSSFCEEQLIQTVRNLFVAGTETTSTAIRWALLLFARRPYIQKKFHAEIKNVIGLKKPSVSDRENMPYVNAFIQELVRHRTLVPLSLPHATTGDTIFNGYFIPKGQIVMPNLWAVHHNPEDFKEPDAFLPERFLDADRNFVRDNRVIPFSIGPRLCLGDQLARMELFLFLTAIVQRFEVLADDSKPLPDFADGIASFAYVPKHFEVVFKVR